MWDVWAVVVAVGFFLGGMPFFSLCCMYKTFWNKYVYIYWIWSCSLVGILWHFFIFENNSNYWGSMLQSGITKNGLSPWTCTYITPKNTVILIPKDVEELKEFVHMYGIKHSPLRVVGSGHTWSGTGYTDGSIIDIRFLNKIVSWNNENITVEAGAKVQDVVQFLFSHGYELRGIGSI
jgi:hypothetical protein